MAQTSATRTSGFIGEDPMIVQALRAQCAKGSGSGQYMASALVMLHAVCGCLDITEDKQLAQYLVSAAEDDKYKEHAEDAIRGVLLGMTAAHESEIMVQHGLFLHYYKTVKHVDQRTGEVTNETTSVPVHSPPCNRGEQCIGMTGQFDGFTNEVKGVVLMAFIYQAELQALKCSGRRPDDWSKRGCVLCVRYLMSQLMVTQAAMHTDVPKGVYAQPWFNPAGMNGAYRLDCVWAPPGETSAHGDGHTPSNNGLVSTFARFDGSALQAIPPSHANGVWTISQAGMIQRSLS